MNLFVNESRQFEAQIECSLLLELGVVVSLLSRFWELSLDFLQEQCGILKLLDHFCASPSLPFCSEAGS